MPQENQIHISQQHYDTKNRDLKQSEVEKIICVFTPVSVLTAALSDSGESIYISYNTQEGNIEWDETFYDKALSNELIFRNQTAKRFAFVLSNKQLLIPDPIYRADAASYLLKDIHHVGADEFVMIHGCKPDKAQLTLSFNHAAEALALKYMNVTALNPLNIFQFLESGKHRGFKIDCLITESTFFGTLRRDGKLLWHQSVPYTTALDIAYHLVLLCKEWNANTELVYLNCSSLVPAATEIINTLSSFFPQAFFGEYPDEDENWWPVFHLAQQINSCVS